MLFPTRSSSAWKPPPATRENLYHELQERGYVLRLLHPRQALRAKTDRLDAMTIAKVLLSGEARAGYVPSERVTAYRELVRLHMQLSDEAAAYQNEIHALVIVLFPEFINEVSTTFRLQHPNIVRLLDFGIGADDTPFLAMDYAPKRPRPLLPTYCQRAEKAASTCCAIAVDRWAFPPCRLSSAGIPGRVRVATFV